MFDDSFQHPFVVSSLRGEVYGRFQSYKEAEDCAIEILKEKNWQERIYINWYDMDIGNFYDQEVLVA